MSIKRRGILMAVGLLTLATVSAATAIQLLYFQLPTPETADGPGLIRWMVTRELSQESPEIRHRLLARARQILPDIVAAGDEPIDQRFDPQYRPQFWRNVDVLVEEWFLQQASLYEQTPADSQPALLDQMLDEIEWLKQLQPTPGVTGPETASSADATAGAMEWMRKFNGWIERAPAERRPSLRRFVVAMQTRQAARMLQGWLKAIGN